MEENKEQQINTNPNNNSNPSPKGKNTGLIVVIMLLVAVIAAGSTYAIMTINNLKNTAKAPASDSRIEEKPETIPDDKAEPVNNVEEETVTTQNPVEETTVTENTATENAEAVSTNAKKSSIENPLKLGEWGIASKRVSKYLSEKYSNIDHVDIPVKVTKVTRGDEAKEMVKKWCEKSSFYQYKEPTAYTEWAVIDYDVDLSGLTFDPKTIGTGISVDTSVKGLDGHSVKYNGIMYTLMTTDTSNKDYVKKPGIYHAQFMTSLPIGCSDYIVQLGSTYSEQTAAFFKCE